MVVFETSLLDLAREAPIGKAGVKQAGACTIPCPMHEVDVIGM